MTKKSADSKSQQNTATETEEVMVAELPTDEISEQKDNANMTDVVAFSLSGRLFGVEIIQVQEVVKFGDVTRVPLAAQYVKGVMNLRGNITPVIDLYTRFSLPASVIGNKTRIIVMNINDQAVGFLVDQVSRIISVADSDVEDVSQIRDDMNSDYINGVVKIQDTSQEEINGELLLMLDLAGIFNDSKLT